MKEIPLKNLPLASRLSSHRNRHGSIDCLLLNPINAYSNHICPIPFRR